MYSDAIAFKNDATAFHGDGVGTSAGHNLTTVLDHTGAQFCGRSGAQDNQTTFGNDGVLVFYLCIKVLFCYRDALQFIASTEIQFDVFACRQHHGAAFGHNHALVSDLRSHERNVAIKLGFQFALIDDLAFGAISLELVVAI